MAFPYPNVAPYNGDMSGECSWIPASITFTGTSNAMLTLHEFTAQAISWFNLILSNSKSP